MAIRITTAVGYEQTVLKVDGWLRSDDVEELNRAYRSVEGVATLDLSELQSADEAGVAVLRELLALGAPVRGASPYIELLLRGQSSS